MGEMDMDSDYMDPYSCFNSFTTFQGGGVNAAAPSMIEMVLVASDPLSELVWSPHNGLHLKCADSSLNPTMSSFLEKENIDEPMEMREISMSNNSLNIKNQEVGEPSHRRNAAENYCNVEEIGASVSDMNGVLKDDKEKNDGLDQTGGTGAVGSNDRKLDMDNDVVSGSNDMKQCKASDTAVAAPKSPGGKDHHFSQDDNILTTLSPTQSRICTYRRKGKEKALSDENLNTKKSQQYDDSHESVESCNSIGLFSKGKKKLESDQNLSNENKRLKYNQDGPGSTSFVRQDSSFVSWIMNMMKAFPNSNQDTTPLALTLAQSSHEQGTHENKFLTRKEDQDLKSKNMGFQNIFKSLYCPDTKARGETSMLNEIYDANAAPLACHGADNVCSKKILDESENYDPSRHKNGGDWATKTKESKVLCNLESNVKKNRVSPACSSLGKRKDNSDISEDNVHKTDPMGSLWISRFCHKASIPRQTIAPHFLNRIDTSKERKLETTENSGASPLMSGNKAETSFGSEAMASIFARRLDALKNILRSDATRLMTCFFCGEKGHDLKDCVKISESELQDLIKNVHSFDGAEESPCLCIKCFQLNHWAVSCPKRSEECGAQKFLEEKRQTKVGGENLAEKPIQVRSFVENHPERNEIGSSLYNFADWQLSELPKGLFDAIKRLRLSRTNILKWMNSQVPLSRLHGFYLRLRLGKSKEGPGGGTGYCVGCINGSPGEVLAGGTKSSIPVDIGGMKCMVESQYVSNHDFLENEVAAWWSVITKCGGNFPTESDVRQKVEDREKLGL